MASSDKQFEPAAVEAAAQGPGEKQKAAIDIAEPLANAAALEAKLTPEQKPGADKAKEELRGTLTELAGKTEAARGETRSALSAEGFVKESALPPGAENLPQTLLTSASDAKGLADKAPPELLNNDYRKKGTQIIGRNLSFPSEDFISIHW